jgi:hypothetical protein
MSKLESLRDIKDTAVRFQETLIGTDIELIRMTGIAARQLSGNDVS